MIGLRGSNRNESPRMKRLLKARIWLASCLALCASAFVWLYNDVQAHNILIANSNLIVVVKILIKLQWIAFMVPLVGACAAIGVRKQKLKLGIFLVPDLLFAFSFVWMAVALLLWQMQQSPVIGLQGIK